MVLTHYFYAFCFVCSLACSSLAVAVQTPPNEAQSQDFF